MKIKLFICVLNDVEQQLSLHDIADLGKTIDIDYVEDKIECVIRIVSSASDLIKIIERELCFSKKSNCLVLSDQLIDSNKDNHQPIPSSTAFTLLEMIKQKTAVCPLIAFTKSKTAHVQGIDANVVLNSQCKDELSGQLKNIVTRLWYKKPPTHQFDDSQEHLYSIKVEPVPDQKALRQCLELRGQVYKTLGYIDHRNNDQTLIEMDSYDLTAIHFHAIDQANQNRLAGTMRLIIPGMSPFAMINHNYKLANFQKWCKNIAKSCKDRQWWNAIEYGSPTALPVLGAFNYFEIPDQTLRIDKSIRSRNVCELSRVVITPEYRGLGISKSLVNHAITVAKAIRRQYLWIECAPHHIKMYEKYGFVVKDNQGDPFYERAQRLDTWAVAMFLNLSEFQNQQSSEHSICYRLQTEGSRAEKCSLLFQFVQQTSSEIKKIFDSPIVNHQLSSKTDVRENLMPLKNLILSTLTTHDIKNFMNCLKQLMTCTRVEKLSLQHSNGNTFNFNPQDIKTGKGKAIESGLIKWLR